MPFDLNDRQDQHLDIIGREIGIRTLRLAALKRESKH